MVTGNPQAGDDPRFRRLSAGALRDSLSGARRAGARGRRRRAAEGRRHHRRHRRLPRPRSRRVGAAALDVSRRRHSGRRSSPCSRRAAPRIMSRSAARSRRCARRNVLIIGSGHATHNLRDWIGHRGQAAAAALRRRLRALARSRRSQRTTSGRSSTIATARRRPRAHIRPKSISFRCSSPTARPGDHAPVERVVDGFENGALVARLVPVRRVASARSTQGDCTDDRRSTSARIFALRLANCRRHN